MLQHWLSFVLDATVALLAVLMVTLATELRVAAGFTGVGLVALMSFAEMMANQVRLYTGLETATGALTRLQTFGEAVPDEAANDEAGVDPEWTWNYRGELRLEGVCAAYKCVGGPLPLESTNQLIGNLTQEHLASKRRFPMQWKFLPSTRLPYPSTRARRSRSAAGRGGTSCCSQGDF